LGRASQMSANASGCRFLSYVWRLCRSLGSALQLAPTVLCFSRDLNDG
jgi:hypothetical protein